PGTPTTAARLVTEGGSQDRPERRALSRPCARLSRCGRSSVNEGPATPGPGYLTTNGVRGRLLAGSTGHVDASKDATLGSAPRAPAQAWLPPPRRSLLAPLPARPAPGAGR